ncbi:hypothetical protein Tco_0619918 [Tanacetum coccineum]
MGRIKLYQLGKGKEDPEKCGETKKRAIIRAMVNKLPEEWFLDVSRDKDDLEGIIDYLEPILYDGFIDYNDEAYKQRRNKLLGMPYTEPPPIKKEKAKITKYNLGAGEGIKSLEEDEDNLIDFLLISNLKAMLREFLVLILLFPYYFHFLNVQ